MSWLNGWKMRAAAKRHMSMEIRHRRGGQIMTPKELKKQRRQESLKDKVESFIADHEMRNHHYLRDDEIISAFATEKPKHVKRAIKELR